MYLPCLMVIFVQRAVQCVNSGTNKGTSVKPKAADLHYSCDAKKCWLPKDSKYQVNYVFDVSGIVKIYIMQQVEVYQ